MSSGSRQHFVASVDTLPWPSTPGGVTTSCLLNEHASRLHREAGGSVEGHQRLNEALITRASAFDLKPCWFHQQRWDLASYVAVAICRRETTSDERCLRQWVQTHRIDPVIVDLALELTGTLTPIRWTSGDEALGNGQHRVCAMKTQGVKETVVYGYT